MSLECALPAGYTPSMCSLGAIYYRGEAVPEDLPRCGSRRRWRTVREPLLRRAVQWFLKAAELGDANAQVRRRSADSGARAPCECAGGQVNLAECYEEGSGVERDLTQARAWFTRCDTRGLKMSPAIVPSEPGRTVRRAAAQGAEDALEALQRLDNA